MTAQGLQPERFGDRNRSERAAHFDYQRGRVTFSANTPKPPLALAHQDRLSVFIQLAGLLAATPDRFVPGTQLSADHRERHRRRPLDLHRGSR